MSPPLNSPLYISAIVYLSSFHPLFPSTTHLPPLQFPIFPCLQETSHKTPTFVSGRGSYIISISTPQLFLVSKTPTCLHGPLLPRCPTAQQRPSGNFSNTVGDSAYTCPSSACFWQCQSLLLSASFLPEFTSQSWNKGCPALPEDTSRVE